VLHRQPVNSDRLAPAKRLAVYPLCLRAPQGLFAGSHEKEKTNGLPKKLARAKPAKEFAVVFAALKEILEPYEKDLQVLPYKPEFYCLVTCLAVHKGKPVWFAPMRMGKNYVSYHRLPVYMNAATPKRIPAGLKKRMQGKACFNFREVGPALFRQLSELTAAGFEDYRALKFV
jgi:hypothetical protein